ncbi:MAG: hypothetical protein LBL92_00455 [Propionibacteriaceae bacterium]|nr:hypothetical protein [Propionibacteriaceae bacterium]
MTNSISARTEPESTDFDPPNLAASSDRCFRPRDAAHRQASHRQPHAE